MCGRPFLPGRCLRSGRWAVGLGVPTDERCRARRARAPSEGARMSSHWPTSGLRGSAGRKRTSSGPPRAQRPAPPPPRGVPRAESASVRARLGPHMCKMAPSPFPRLEEVLPMKWVRVCSQHCGWLCPSAHRTLSCPYPKGHPSSSPCPQALLPLLTPGVIRLSKPTVGPERMESEATGPLVQAWRAVASPSGP